MIASNSRVQLDKLGEHNGGILPTGYWLRGILGDEPIVGRILCVWRTERAAQYEGEIEPVVTEGIYTSSPVRSIVENEDGSVTCITANSTWRVTPLPESSISSALSTSV